MSRAARAEARRLAREAEEANRLNNNNTGAGDGGGDHDTVAPGTRIVLAPVKKPTNVRRLGFILLAILTSVLLFPLDESMFGTATDGAVNATVVITVGDNTTLLTKTTILMSQTIITTRIAARQTGAWK